MSTVWQTRYRVLWQQLERLADRLSGTQPPVAMAEHTVRLLTFAITLLEQHRVDRRGRCPLCGWSRWRWRLWHRRPQCTVCQALAFSLDQSLDVVWWKLLTGAGEKCSLADVREWLEKRQHPASSVTLAVLAEHDDTIPLIPLPSPEQTGPPMNDPPSP